MVSNLAGMRFSKWTILHESKRVFDRPSYRCRCDCGVERDIRKKDLLNGKSESCGCSRTKHGLTKSPEYRAWDHMKQRCYNPDDQAFSYYGERGIKVCPEWLDSFEAFLKDMGPRPTPKHTLERSDNSKGYSPENCVWATRKEQQNNTRWNVLITFKGVTKTRQQWADQLGVSSQVMYDRLKSGWSVKRAVTTPLDTRYSR